MADIQENSHQFDGEGLELKRTERNRAHALAAWSSPETNYYLRSSVLGGKIVSETKADGTKSRTNIYAGGKLLAQQNYYTNPSPSEVVEWEHYDASGMTKRNTRHNYPGGAAAETDAHGRDVGLLSPPNRDQYPNSPGNPMPAPLVNQFGGCTRNGVAMDCSLANWGTNGGIGNGSAASAMNFGIDIPFYPGPMVDLHPDFADWLVGKGLWFEQDLFKLGQEWERIVANGERFKLEMEKFLKKNPNCRKAIERAGNKLKLGNFDTFVAGLKVYDGSANTVRTTPGFDPGSPNETLDDVVKERQAERNVYAVTTSRGVFLTELTVNRFKPLFRGMKLFHETFHGYGVDGNAAEEHLEIVRQLGISGIPRKPSDAHDNYDSIMAKLSADAKASMALDQWIERGCPDPVKK